MKTLVAMRIVHRSLILVTLLFLLLATVYNAVVPLGEGPDEPGHMAYVFFLGREGRLPVQQADPARSDVPGEGHQPPLAYLLALPAVAWLPPTEQRVTLRNNPHFVWSGGDAAAAFVRGSREYWPWQGATLAWRLARAVSALLGALTVICTWGAARMLAGPARPGLALLAAALVALHPQFLFTSALVTNDALLTTLSAALFWLCVAWGAPAVAPPAMWRRRSTRVAASAGLLLGLALLTKQNALLLAPLLLWASWRASGGSWRELARLVALWAGVALLIAGWWYGRNWLLYGDPFGLGLFRVKFATQAFDWHSAEAWQSALIQLFASFWARFGWLSLHPPRWTLWVYAALTLVALAGLVRAATGARRSSPPIMQRSEIALALLPLLALAWTISFVLTAGLVGWQGRMLFPALPAFAILLARGLLAWETRRAAAVGVAFAVHTALLAALVALALFMPFTVIAPAYEWRTLPPAVAQARITTPVYARYAQSWERGVELRGWRLDRPLRPGATVTVTLTWHALEPIPADWTVFVHLVNAERRIVAEDNRRPHAGAAPMPQWTTGDWLEDDYRLDLPADLPPGNYTMHVGLFLPQVDWRRQAVWAANGDFVGDQAVIATITAP